ncbi:MAG: hypothetical protein ACI8VT_003034 [Saprospiraceae bacterium]|jgi:hypothetical protein
MQKVTLFYYLISTQAIDNQLIKIHIKFIILIKYPFYGIMKNQKYLTLRVLLLKLYFESAYKRSLSTQQTPLYGQYRPFPF